LLQSPPTHTAYKRAVEEGNSWKIDPDAAPGWC